MTRSKRDTDASSTKGGKGGAKKPPKRVVAVAKGEEPITMIDGKAKASHNPGVSPEV